MILYLLSDIEDAKQFEWLVDSNQNKNNFKIKFILINNSNKKSKLENFLKRNDSLIKKFYYKKKFSFFIIILKLFFLLIRNKPKIIHCHARKASIIGIVLSYILGIKKRIYTRHHGNENDQNYFKGYLVDKLISILSTNIVSISNNTTELLIKENKKNLSKITEINHGFNFDEINKINLNKIDEIRKKYKINVNKTVIGVISRFINWKGVEFTIMAFKEYFIKNPHSVLIIANANGPYKKNILHYLNDIPKKNYILIDFETDIISLYRTFDIFVHVPIDPYCEAFGQVYIESLALKIPSIFTKSGIGNDFLQHKKNCFIANYKDYNSIYNGILYFKEMNKKEKKQINEKGYNDVCEKFSLYKMLSKFENLYKNE